MAYNLLGIIDVVKAISVTVGGTAITVYDVDAVRGWAQRSGLPARLFLPFTDPGAGNMRGVLGEIGIGNSSAVTWTFTDRLLYQEASGGAGVQDYSDELATYIVDYLNAAAALEDWSSITNAVAVQTVDAQVRVINFPAGSGQYYTGVDVVWTLREDDPYD